MAEEKRETPKGPVEVLQPIEDHSDGPEQKDSKDASKPRGSLHFVTKRDIDDTTLWYNQHKHTARPLTEKEGRRVARKNFWFLLIQTWWVAFLIHLDKSTLSQASTMGLFKDVHMTKNQKNNFNHLFVIFFAGYLIALWPGAALAQRIGQKQFIVGSLFLWAFLLGMHPLATQYSHLIVLRFFLGMVSHISIQPRRQAHANVSSSPSLLGRIPDCPVDHRASPSLLPTQEESLGSAAVVGVWQFCQRPFDHGFVPANPRRQGRHSRWWSEFVEVDAHCLCHPYFRGYHSSRHLAPQLSCPRQVAHRRRKSAHDSCYSRDPCGHSQQELQVVPGARVLYGPQELAVYVSKIIA